MPRQHAEPDVTSFEPLIADAVRAFGTDLGYATEMAARAVTILAKRETWTARTTIRDAEAAARAECEAVPTFVCSNPSPTPCGVSRACLFSVGELRDLEVPVRPPAQHGAGRLVQRPQPGPDGEHVTYNTEAAVLVLRDQRAVGHRPA